MRQERVDRDGNRTDVRFELPPQLSERAERRMASRAEAAWRAIAGGQMPSFDPMDFGCDSEFATNALLLDLRLGDRVDVIHAGDAIVATFGIGPGALSGSAAATLAGLLLDACALTRLNHSTVPIEGVLIEQTGACLLTRGVVLPFADHDGHLSFAHCVLNWKEILDRQANERLRSALSAALRATNTNVAARGQLWRME